MKRGINNNKHKRTLQTQYIMLNTRNCEACWKCIEACTNDVIDRINVLWHKHARIRNHDRCTGCLKCVKVCEAGALTKI